MTNKKDINAPISILLLGSDTELGKAIESYYQTDFDFTWTQVHSSDVIKTCSSVVSGEYKIGHFDAIIDAYSLRHVSQNDYAEFHTLFQQILALAECPVSYMLSGVQVFTGDKDSSYLETDVMDAKSKMARALIDMETLVLSDPKHIVLRTGWLFSGRQDDFVCNTIELMKRQEHLRFHDSAVGCPTPVSDVARVLLSMVKQRHYGATNSGIYHYCCAEEVSWMGLVEAILTTSTQYEPKAHAALESIVDGAAAEEVLTAGKRQSLSCRKIFNHFGIKQRSWRPVLRTLIKEYFQGRG